MKLKRFLSVILATLCVSSFAACNNVEKPDTSEETFEPLAYIQSFDKYKDMFNCGFVSFWGKVDLTEEHAVSGTAAKMQIQQVQAYSSAPHMHIDMKREDYGYDYSDLSMVDYVGFYAYNANDFEGTLKFEIISEDGRAIVSEIFVLAPNSGENVRIRINRTAMKIDNVTAKNLRFSVNREDNSVWYFDDIYVEKAYDPIIITDKAFDTDNLLDFNNIEDINYVKKDSAIASTAHVVTLSTKADGGIVQEGAALQVSFKRTLEPDGDYTIQPQYYYSGVALEKAFCDHFDFNKLATKNLCVDVYSAMNKTMTYILRFTDGRGTTFDKVYEIAPNTWHTLTFNTGDLGEGATLRMDAITKVSVYVKYQDMDGDETSFYLDNIRLEDIAV